MAAEKTRNTRQKQLILDILRNTAGPLTASDIYARAVEQQPTLAKSTVYRNLESLRERGEVSHGLLENGESLYQAIRPHEHKHYMICKGCSAVVDLPDCPLRDLERQLGEKTGFTITDHMIQLYGYCRDCAKKKNP